MLTIGGNINVQSWTDTDKKALAIATEAFENAKPNERQSFQRYLEDAYTFLKKGNDFER